MELKAEILVEWEVVTVNDLDHYPENFVYSFVNPKHEVLYVGTAHLESPKTEIPKMLSRLGLKAGNVQVLIGYLNSIASNQYFTKVSLKKFEGFLHYKYQPTLNKTINFEDVEMNNLVVKGDDLLAVVRANMFH